MAGFNDTLKQATQFWATRDTRQKVFLLAGAVATVALLIVFAGMINKPDMKPLATGMEPADAQALGAMLSAQNIAHETSPDGKTLSVEEDKLPAAQMLAASQGAPHSGRTGFELFDKMSWGQTEFDEKVTYQRALEGELGRTIETLSEVKSARVHLVMATDSVFADKERAGKASVTLKLRGNGLSKESVQAISRLVSGAVDDLKPEDVSIVDADSDRSLGLGHDGLKEGDALDTSLQQRLISTLEPVVGLDKIRASVNIDRDHGSSEENQERYDPAVSAVLSSQKSEDQVGGAAVPSGVPGVTSNVPSEKGSKPAATASTDHQSSMSETAQYGVNKVLTHRVVPAGGIQRVSAAILVDDAVVKTVKNGKTTYSTRKRTPEELTKIQEIAQEVIGFDAKRGDTISVQNMSFDSNPGDADTPVLALGERVKKTAVEYGPILRPVSLLALFLMAYLFVLRPIQKQAFTPQKRMVATESGLVGSGSSERFSLGTPEYGDPTVRASTLKDQAIDLVKQKPVNTTRAVQAWLREETL